METCSVVLTFESVDKILWCDHSNETSLAVLLYGTITELIVSITKFLIVIGHPPAYSRVIGKRSRGCPITAIQLQLSVIGYL